MDNMNFLNKKYTSIHNTNTFSLSNSHSRSSRTFMPSHNPHLIHNNNHNHSHHQSQKQFSVNATQPIITTISNANAQLSANHCIVHTSQLIRHLCLDCIQLLCSQCISQHILVHKDNNSFPNIHTLKQVKSDMNIKLQQITQYMLKQKNHPKHISSTIQTIRKQSIQKIDNLRKQMIQIIQQWILRLKAAIINNVGYQQIKLLQQQMYTLHEQVNQLINSLSMNNVSVHDIKKAYQIDADRLQKSYKEMMGKYIGLSDTMKVDIQLDRNKFMESLEQVVALRLGGKNKNQVIKIDDDQHQQQQQSQIVQNQLVQQNIKNVNKVIHQIPNYHIPFLYNVTTGTDTLKILDPASPNLGIKQYRLQGLIGYPLNSVCLLNDGMVIIGGGMIAQNKKSDIVQVFDYQQGKVVSQVKMNKGRSSHRMVADGDRIFIIGGFTTDNQDCRDIQILTVDGIKTAQHKCKWGGPNLSIRTTNQILKITVSGVQSMNMLTLKWQQLTTQVPFALSKGMQISSYIDKQNNQIIVVFGDDQYYYKWNSLKRKFDKLHSNLNKSVISATCVNNTVYGWIDDNKNLLSKLEADQWIIFGSK